MACPAAQGRPAPGRAPARPTARSAGPRTSARRRASWRREHEQGPAVLAAERAGEAEAVQLDRLEHLRRPRRTRAHDFVSGVHTAPSASRQIPSPPSPSSAHTRRSRESRRRASTSNAVSRPANDSAQIRVEPSGVTTIPFGNCEPVGDLADLAVGRDQRDQARRELAAAHEVEVDRVDVGVTAAVDHDLVPASAAMSAVRSAWVTSEPSASRRRSASGAADDQQPAVGEPVDRDRDRRPSCTSAIDLAVAVEVDREDLALTPVGEPEAAVVPAGALADAQAGQQRVRGSWAGHRTILPVWN